MGRDHPIEKPIILYDGVCNLCSWSVRFIIKRDKENQFLFASLQSEFAQANLPNTLLSNSEVRRSIVLKEEDKIKTKSSAVLTISKHLSGLWPLLYVFMMVPKIIRDWIYDIIAENRYRWFGKKDQCMIPSPELKSRFID